MAEQSESGEAVRVEGYIVFNAKGSSLNSKLGWTETEDEKEAFVLPAEKVAEIAGSMSAEWNSKPFEVLPAVFENGNVTVTGGRIKIGELPPLQEK